MTIIIEVLVPVGTDTARKDLPPVLARGRGYKPSCHLRHRLPGWVIYTIRTFRSTPAQRMIILIDVTLTRIPRNVVRIGILNEEGRGASPLLILLVGGS